MSRKDRGAVIVFPHHPDCRAVDGTYWPRDDDPERCCYCAAVCRAAMGMTFGGGNVAEDPLDFRYGGPRCGCSVPTREADRPRTFPVPEVRRG